MTTRRRFLLASSLARLIQRERGGPRQIEGFFPEQKERTSWVRLEETRAFLILRTAGPDSDVEEHTEVPTSHAQALLDVCAGEIDYTRTPLTIGQRQVFVDQFARPPALYLLSVEFENNEEAKGFHPLPWFGPEVTADAHYSNQALALRGIEQSPDVPLSDIALNSLLDTLENRLPSRSRVAINRPTAKQVPVTKAQVAGSAPGSERLIKVSLDDVEAAMMREMEAALQNNPTK
jgi:CYTH domain-containing protein